LFVGNSTEAEHAPKRQKHDETWHGIDAALESDLESNEGDYDSYSGSSDDDDSRINQHSSSDQGSSCSEEEQDPESDETSEYFEYDQDSESDDTLEYSENEQDREPGETLEGSKIDERASDEDGSENDERASDKGGSENDECASDEELKSNVEHVQNMQYSSDEYDEDSESEPEDDNGLTGIIYNSPNHHRNAALWPSRMCYFESEDLIHRAIYGISPALVAEFGGPRVGSFERPDFTPCRLMGTTESKVNPLVIFFAVSGIDQCILVPMDRIREIFVLPLSMQTFCARVGARMPAFRLVPPVEIFK
jgi:hypothetical protein